MMKVFRYYIPAIALVLLAAYGGHVYGVHKTRNEDAGLFELLRYSSLANEMNIKMKLLNMIDDGRLNDSKVVLNKLIDLDLASLCLYDKLAQSNPNQTIFDAIAAVKKYREAHPGHKVSEAMSNSVERAFKITNSNK